MASQLTIKRGDTRPFFGVSLVDGSGVEVVLATNDSVRFSMRESSSQTVKVNRAVAVFEAGGGDVEYRWQAGDTDTAGEYECEWEVTFADGTIQTFPAYDYDLVYIEGDIA